MSDAVYRLSADPVVDEALKRWRIVSDWESVSRSRYLKDVKVAEGDAYNQYQWDNAIRDARELDTKPCLTINVIRQHNIQIINEGKKNKSEIKVQAVGGGATKEAADLLTCVLRNIAYRSKAQSAYQTAREWQVKGGIGWWRLTTTYVGSDTFDQEILIERIADPLSVYCDPDAKERDKSDMRYAFVYDIIPKDEFEENYPQYKDKITASPLGTGGDFDLSEKDRVRVCEYWRKVKKLDKVVSFIDKRTKERKTVLASKLPTNIKSAVLKDEKTKTREVWIDEVEWYLLVGEEICDQTSWLGSKIPLIPVLGEETVLSGQLDRKGHTRALIDAQKMFNFNASGQVEFVSAQGKTPWVAPVAALEEVESYWNTANTVNYSVLPYKHLDDDGNPIPAPTRTMPPSASPAFQSGMDTAFNQLMMASGQWQNQMGMGGNERTGEAITRRQAQGDLATFHFHDNFQEALMNCGRQIIELIPLVYDTKRLLLLLNDQGEEIALELDPKAAQIAKKQLAADNKTIHYTLNPTVGKYDVQVETGPDFGTKREETVQALTLLLTQAPALVSVIGDLLLQSMDFEAAQEAASRLRRMVPAQALGQGPSQQETLQAQQIKSLQSALAIALQDKAKDTLKLVGKAEMRDIDVYEAETKRLATLKEALGVDPAGLEELVRGLVKSAMEDSLGNVTRVVGEDLKGNEMAVSRPSSPSLLPQDVTSPSPSPSPPTPSQ